MENFTPFPCCACSVEILDRGMPIHLICRNIRKLNESKFIIKRIVENVLKKTFFDINPKLSEFNLDDDYLLTFSQLKGREKNMIQSINVLLNQFYKIDPSQVDVNTVNEMNDMGVALNQNLEKILEDHNRIAENPFEIASGKTTYQRLVLDCLFFAVKFMSQCTDKLKKDNEYDLMRDIFIETSQEINSFFFRKNISNWIIHSIHYMNPFGVISDDKKDSLNENELEEEKTKKQKII